MRPVRAIRKGLLTNGILKAPQQHCINKQKQINNDNRTAGTGRRV